MSYFSSKAKIIYSDEQATLSNASEIDSGYIDMEGVDKAQISASSSISGMTLIITSKATLSGAELATPVTYDDGTFYLANIVCRQRYMKFQWQNNTGGSVNDAILEIKQTFGSSDKLSVFPVGVNPSVFSQAALVQAIIRGKQPDGDYVSIPADGTAVSTTSTLTSGVAYLSPWIDSDGWNSIDLFISTDVKSAEKGIEIEFTDDVQAGTPVVRATKKYTYGDRDVVRGFSNLKIPPLLDGFRVRYTNGSVGQASFFLDAVLKTNSENTAFNSGGAALTSEFLTEVALGNISNYETGTKHGRNPDVDTGPEDMWNGGDTYTGQPSSFTPETVNVFSSSTADSSAGTGARTIKITGLKSSTSTQYETENITMNGTTAVTSVSTWWRVNRAIVLTGGTGGGNAGTITVRSTTTTANVFVKIPIGWNQTTIGAYTVPDGKKMVIKRVRVSIVRTNGSAGSATITLRIRPNGGVYNASRVFELQTGTGTQFELMGGLVVESGSDIKFRVETVSDTNTVAEGAFEYVLLNN